MDSRQLLTEMIREVHERHASDLHVAPGSPPMLRVLGELETSRMAEPLTPEQTREVAYMLMRDKTRHTYDEKMEVDFSFTVQGGGRYRVKALTQIADYNAAFGTAFSDQEHDTVAGLLIAHLGRLPKRGETVMIEGCRFQVLRADSRRVYTLLVDKPK